MEVRNGLKVRDAGDVSMLPKNYKNVKKVT